MRQASLPFEIKHLSKQDFDIQKIKQQLSAEAVLNFKNALEDVFGKLNVLAQFHDKVELSLYNKETDLIDEIFTYSYDKEQIKIGKDAGNDIVIRERYISREHAIFKLDEKGVSLTDKGSTNGTYINGIRMNPDESHQLNSEDILHFGAQKIRFSIKKEIAKGVDIDASCHLHHVRRSSIFTSPQKIPFFICSSIKQNKTVLFEFDWYFFFDIVNSLLGFGQSDDFLYEKPVTKVEEGLFLYFFISALEIINSKLLDDDDILVFDKISYLDDLTLADEYIMLALSMNANRKKYGIRAYVEGDSFNIASKKYSGINPYFLNLFSLKPVELMVIAGETSLSAEEMTSLNKESILLIEKWHLREISPQADENIVLEQFNAGICLKGKIAGTEKGLRISIDQFFKKENLNMEDFEKEKEKTISSIESTIYVVIASRKITLAELSKLSKGDILDFGSNINNKVCLIVNNAVIAKGELIEYEGKIGVEITDVMY